MKARKEQFEFLPAGYGHMRVTFRDEDGTEHTRTTNNMKLIDLVKHEEQPHQVNLDRLKRMCKGGEQWSH